MKSTGLTLVLVVLGLGSPVQAQGNLQESADRARYAWMVHDMNMLTSAGDSVLIRLPGEEEVTVRAGQAARLLRRYLDPTEERALELGKPTPTGEKQAYVEGERRYVVRGTSDILTQTVFFGFRQASGRWKITEIRVTP